MGLDDDDDDEDENKMENARSARMHFALSLSLLHFSVIWYLIVSVHHNMMEIEYK